MFSTTWVTIGYPIGNTLSREQLHRVDQVLVDDLRVDLGCVQAAVAEQGLDEADVGTAAQQRRGEGVAKAVRNAVRDAGRLTLLMAHPLDRLALVVLAV